MMLNLRAVAPAGALLIAVSISGTAPAQNQGGILRIYNPESIASLSMLEEFAGHGTRRVPV